VVVIFLSHMSLQGFVDPKVSARGGHSGVFRPLFYAILQFFVHQGMMPVLIIGFIFEVGEQSTGLFVEWEML